MVLKKTVFFLLIFAVAVVEINGQNEVTKENISQHKKKIRNKNVLTRILHRKHVCSLTFSEDIDKELLVQNPDELKKLIDKEEVKTNEYNRAIARNMFLTYLLDE